MNFQTFTCCVIFVLLPSLQPNKRKSTPPSQTIQTATSLADDDEIRDMISSMSAGAGTDTDVPVDSKLGILDTETNPSDAGVFATPETSHQSVFQEPACSGGPVFPGQDNGAPIFPGQETGGAVFPGQEHLGINSTEGAPQTELQASSQSSVPGVPSSSTDQIASFEQMAQSWQQHDGLTLSPSDESILTPEPVKRSPKVGTRPNFSLVGGDLTLLLLW